MCKITIEMVRRANLNCMSGNYKRVSEGSISQGQITFVHQGKKYTQKITRESISHAYAKACAAV